MTRLGLWWSLLTARFHPCPLCGRYRGKPHAMCTFRIENAMNKAGILDFPYRERP